MWSERAAVALILAGAFFVLVSSIGVFRLPDFYLRVHAPTKAATLGLFFLLGAFALDVRDRAVVTKAILAVLFIGTTAPVGAHLLTRAAYRHGVPSCSDPETDEYAAVVQRRRADRAVAHACDLDAEAPSRSGGIP